MERWAAEGLRERPPGSDRVPALVALARELGVSELYAEMGYPWCAFAAFLAALVHGGHTAEAGLRRERSSTPSTYRRSSARLRLAASAYA